MYVDLMGTEKANIVVPEFVTNFAEDAIDFLDYVGDNQERLQHNIGKSLVAGGTAVVVITAPACATTVSVTGGCAVVTSPSGPGMLVCTAPAISAGASCGTMATGAGIAALGGAMMSSSNGGGTKKPYSKSRPSYGKGQVDNVWNNAKGPDGVVRDPNTGKILKWDKTKKRNGQWDMGHTQGNEYRNLYKDYMDGKINKKGFLQEYRNPKNYKPEYPGANRSRIFEIK